MLIINADDWGRSEAETDAAMVCVNAGSVTSLSAMVFMQDSERAAQMARDHKLDVGLHLNFAERFTGDAPPESVADQSALVTRLRRNNYSHLIYFPGLRAKVAAAFTAQWLEFERLYKQPPTHLDGHHHLHLASNLVFGNILPSGLKLRRNFSFFPGEKSLLNRSYRRFVDSWLKRNHCLPDYFFCLSQSLADHKMERISALSQSANVELMSHPVVEAESKFLLSSDFAGNLAHVRLGGYASL
jgi:predicted glycoside hydrolase/deacetylase ChbG (UPF0249 family)